MKETNIITLEKERFHEWNLFVDQSPQGDMFCYSWWLEAMTQSRFKIIAAIENNEIVAGMPIAFDELGKINEPLLVRTLGVLYKHQKGISEYKQTSNQRRWINALLAGLPLDNFVRMSFHPNFTDWLPLRWKGFKQTTKYTYIIKYPQPADNLWKNLNNMTQRIIKKAQAKGIRIEQDNNLELLYQFLSLTYQRQGREYIIPFERIKALDKAVRKNGNRIMFKAVDTNNQVHAMVYISFNKKSAYLLLSGSDPKYRKLGGHTLVLWQAIQFFKGKTGYFNFGGSNIERIERHFRGFGGSLTPYFEIYNENIKNNLRYHLSQILSHFKAIIKLILKKH